MSKLFIKITWLALLANRLTYAGALDSNPASSSSSSQPVPWLDTFTVLVLSFGIAATVGYFVDAYFKTKEAIRPDVDAYIDDLVTGNNGLHLNRTGRRD